MKIFGALFRLIFFRLDFMPPEESAASASCAAFSCEYSSFNLDCSLCLHASREHRIAIDLPLPVGDSSNPFWDPFKQEMSLEENANCDAYGENGDTTLQPLCARKYGWNRRSRWKKFGKARILTLLLSRCDAAPSCTYYSSHFGIH